jgi:hypothetical protein
MTPPANRERSKLWEIIVEARVENTNAATNNVPIRLAVIDRVDDDLEILGFSLEEGRELMAAAQSAAISAHMQQWLRTVNAALLEPSSHTCVYPWKGTVNYYSLNVKVNAM